MRGQIRSLREQRLSGAEIAERLALPRSTVARWLRRWGLGRLRQLAAPEPVRRYQKQFAGELLHLDIKKLGKRARDRRGLRPHHPSTTPLG